MDKHKVTVERLRELLSYDPQTGNLTWRVGRCNVAAGAIAGGVNDQGYMVLRVDGVAMRCHRVAWAIMTGSFPANLIDHENRNRSDNRWSNLREATHSQNHQNMVVRKDCRHGHRGIELHQRGGWKARLTVRGKRIHLGYFKTAEEAIAARIAGEKMYFTHSPVCEPQSACHETPCLQDETGLSAQQS